MSECLGDFPLVDETKVTVLLKEYYLLDAKEDKEWHDIARRNKTSKEIESLVKDRIQWIINFVGTLPDGEWNRQKEPDIMFLRIWEYIRFLERIKTNNEGKLSGETHLWHIDEENFSFEYCSGFDDGYPERNWIHFPKALVLMNDQRMLRKEILEKAARCAQDALDELEKKQEQGREYLKGITERLQKEENGGK